MNTANEQISRGEIFYISSKYDTTGSEQRSGRPAVVVSNNLNNKHSECVEICYLTLQEKKSLPTHIKIDRGECYNSTILCEQVTTVSKERLGDYICRLPDDLMDAVDKALVISLGLDYIIEKNESAVNKPASVPDSTNGDKNASFVKELMYQLDCTRKELEVAKEANAVIKEKAAKSAMYEQMYNDLLDRLTRR